MHFVFPLVAAERKNEETKNIKSVIQEEENVKGNTAERETEIWLYFH